ncbi:hypothetical protein ACO2Q9_03225 [Variovorax sp. VNK109]|jgi:hypothetical protein|uniref:hypothetical protein n=1 Tax=Variovorax sp. VNK109 TaxID=3400919 RepID=UPI003C001EC5
MINATFTVGKFVVTPLTRLMPTGSYSASVSIRRGMYDRVFRFVPTFSCDKQAQRYAIHHGRSLALHGLN